MDDIRILCRVTVIDDGNPESGSHPMKDLNEVFRGSLGACQERIMKLREEEPDSEFEIMDEDISAVWIEDEEIQKACDAIYLDSDIPGH